jgi:hypothetical protein
MSICINVKSDAVDIDDFIKKFSTKWTDEFGNVLSAALIETWMQNVKVLNNAVQDNQDGYSKKYVISAVTGSAKTENIITYSSMLPSNIKVLICTNLKDETDRLAKDINIESGYIKAVSFHSGNKIKDYEAKDYQIVIVTHEFYRRHYEGTDRWNTLTDDRDLIVIDEALDTIVENSITKADIQRVLIITDRMSSWKRYSSNIAFQKSCQSLQHELNSFNTYIEKVGSGTRLLNSEQVKYSSFKDLTGDSLSINETAITEIMTTRYEAIIEAFRNDTRIKYNVMLVNRQDDEADIHTKRTMIESLQVLQSLYKQQIYMSSNNGTRSLNVTSDSTPNKTIVCFDATSTVSETYKLRAKHHGDLILIPKVENTRNYETVNIYTATAKTGVDSYNSTDKAKKILANVAFGEKTLIVTHKSNKAYFSTAVKDMYPDKYIEVAHWGALTGLNTWQDFDTCICVGLLHKPISVAQNRNIHNTSEEIAFGLEQKSINQRIAETTILSEIIQAMNRIRVRKTTDIHGRCKEANIYLTLPLSNTNFYLKVIANEMKGINFKDWAIPEAITPKEAQGYLHSIIEYLDGNLERGDEVSIYRPRGELNINTKSYSKIINKSNFSKRIEDFGFEIISKNEIDSRGRKKKKSSRHIRRFS